MSREGERGKEQEQRNEQNECVDVASFFFVHTNNFNESHLIRDIFYRYRF